MTHFTTPCFVRVEDAEKRKELIEWLGNIGNPYAVGRNLVLVGREDEAYNCGDNIPLFKALAAMNDKNDREQWFVNINTGEWALSEHDDLGLTKLIWDKATSEEIIEHFKNQKS